jgi:hypothetical protein
MSEQEFVQAWVQLMAMLPLVVGILVLTWGVVGGR